MVTVITQILSWLIKGDVMYSHKVPGYCGGVSHHILESVCVHWQALKFHSFMFEICSPVSPYQDTPLHLATRGGHTDTVHYLSDKGAGINITNNIGVSEWDCNAD